MIVYILLVQGCQARDPHVKAKVLTLLVRSSWKVGLAYFRFQLRVNKPFLSQVLIKFSRNPPALPSQCYVSFLGAVLAC